MKSMYLASVLSFFVFSGVVAQDEDPGPGAVTVFSEDGENFTLFLNGEKANATPASRATIENVKEVSVSARIVFENSTTPELKKNLYRQGRNCVYTIVKNKKGELVLRMKECSEEAPVSVVTTPAKESEAPIESAPEPAQPLSTPEQLSATYSKGIITINDGRTITVKQVKANSFTNPKVIITVLTGAKISFAYDDNNETYSAETPLQYVVKDYRNNNSYFTMTVDEGGPKKTWKVKLQNGNGYDIRIE
jgi:hypothetical protein